VLHVKGAVLPGDLGQRPIEQVLDPVVSVGDDDADRLGAAHDVVQAEPRLGDRRAEELHRGSRPAPRDVSTHHRARDVDLHSTSRASTPVAGAGRHPCAVDQHRRDIVNVAPWQGEVAAFAGPGHDPTDGGRGRAVAGLGQQLRRRPGEGELGGELRRPPGKTRRHPAPAIDTEELEHRRESATAPATHLGETQLHPSQTGEQDPAPGTAAPPPEPPLAVARRTPERSLAAPDQRSSSGSTHPVKQRVLIGLEQPGPDLGSQLPIGGNRGALEPDEVMGF